MRRTWASPIPVRLVGRPQDVTETLVPFSFWGPTCDTIDYMKGPFLLPAKIKEGDYIEIGNTGAYGRALAAASTATAPSRRRSCSMSRC